jgi:hypothetical protein
VLSVSLMSSSLQTWNNETGTSSDDWLIQIASELYKLRFFH